MRPIKLLLITLVLLSSCSREQIRFVPVEADKENQSVIYIYRQNSLSNVVISPDLLVDGKKVISIKNNSYIYVLLHSGKHNIKLDLTGRYKGLKTLDIDIADGKTYFFKILTAMKFKMNKPYERHFDIQQVGEDQALEEIKTIPFAGKKPATKEVLFNDNISINKNNKSRFSIHKTRSPFSN